MAINDYQTVTEIHWHPRPYPHPGKTCSGWCVNMDHYIQPQRIIEKRCPSTYRYLDSTIYVGRYQGVQCRFTLMHEGQHCGYVNATVGDIFWS